ncbi:MAG: hypothetical protein Unbinned1529contig1001_34 [Prokaryotic dsDNA virus sp.]|nr:MAG: hypothetical protein Unbinned1529contig1001_34 [Prokaryotic dsDNA virus sp.]|tara:strand:- start:205 stop:495 length:291 start_codon:yes stop_codon:yes gene_type:complete
MFIYKITPKAEWTTMLVGDPISMQDAVGGWLELLITRHGDVFCNEEGKMQGLPFNPTATAICGKPIVGTVVLKTESPMFEQLVADAEQFVAEIEAK